MGSLTAQKHVYATHVADLLGVPYISMGSLVRQELQPRSSLYKMLERTFGLLSKRLEEGYQRGENGYILDGIPRTRIQAEILDQIVEIDLVVNLKCDACAHCGRPFDPSNSASTDLNPCLATRTRHAMLSPSAATELEETCSEKQHGYSEQSKLVEEYYKKQNKLLDFHGLLSALRLQHTMAPDPSLL